MTNDLKALQQLAENPNGVSTLEWSTISHTHAMGPGFTARDQNVDIEGAVTLIKQLQTLPHPAEASPMEWSTISHTHAT